MQCPSCATKKPMKSELITHRFKESGLDYVILHGVKQHRCLQCGEVLFDFGDVNQLNNLIADTLLRKRDLLTGQEIRFLRTYIGYSSEMFARIIGLDKTSLSRIENNRAKISNQVNMAVRFIVGGKMVDRDYNLHDLIVAIEKQELISFKLVEFKAVTKGGWQLQAG